MVYITYSNATFLSSALCILISSILYILLVSLTELHYSQINSIKITTKNGFRDLQNYTTLKSQAPFEFVPVGFKLHYSQTHTTLTVRQLAF